MYHACRPRTERRRTLRADRGELLGGESLASDGDPEATRVPPTREPSSPRRIPPIELDFKFGQGCSAERGKIEQTAPIDTAIGILSRRSQGRMRDRESEMNMRASTWPDSA